MYLVDTDVVSEVRKRSKANPGVRRVFANAHVKGDALYLSVVTVGEIRRGIESIRPRADGREPMLVTYQGAGYLHRFARQHANAIASRTYVAADGSAILGFYSLAMSAIRRENLPS